MPVDQANSERMRTTAHDDPQASPLFDTPCSSVSSVLLVSRLDRNERIPDETLD